jgi:hypothetical protein
VARNLAGSFVDQLVGKGEQLWWDLKAERFGGFEVDDQLEFGGLLHRKIGRLGAFEYLSDKLPARRKASS